MNGTSRRTEARPGRGHRRLASLTGLALATVMAAACGDSTGPKQEDPVVVTDEMCSSSQVALCTSATAMSVAKDATSDGMTRSAPALENVAGRTAIVQQLAQLNAALAAGNVTKTRAALNEARAAINAARGQLSSFPGDAPDLTAIELLLDHITPLVG